MDQLYFWQSDDCFSNKEIFLFMVHEMQCLVHVSLSNSLTVMRFQRIGTVTLKVYCYYPMPFRSAIDWSLSTKILIHLT